MDNDRKLKALPALDCMPPMVPICVEARCACIPPPPIMVPGEVVRSVPQCVVSVEYHANRPDIPSLYMSGGECAASAEVALAFALAAYLRAAGAVPK